jgi:ferredoxin, 2Fe-2S
VSISFVIEDAAGTEHTVSAPAGTSVMKAAVAAGLGGSSGIAADCGMLSCATCHIIVAPAWWPALQAVGEDEQAMLEMTASPCTATSRLSCQVLLHAGLEGLRLRLPATQY